VNQLAGLVAPPTIEKPHYRKAASTSLSSLSVLALIVAWPSRSSRALTLSVHPSGQMIARLPKRCWTRHVSIEPLFASKQMAIAATSFLETDLAAI